LLSALSDPIAFFGIIIGLVVGISVHEFSHAWMANRLGDPTTRYAGRLTLNPLAHLDLLGSLMIFLIGFGWGKPVPYNPANLRNGPISGGALVALAGPAANLITAASAGLLLRIGSSGALALPSGGVIQFVFMMLSFVLYINVALAIFNIIPIPPLDGYRVLLRFLPPRWVPHLYWLEAQGPLVLLLIVLLDNWFLHINLFGRILGPPVEIITSMLRGA